VSKPASCLLLDMMLPTVEWLSASAVVFSLGTCAAHLLCRLAKHYGSYSRLPGGFTHVTLAALTGGLAMRVILYLCCAPFADLHHATVT
jgi:hypothetical protein